MLLVDIHLVKGVCSPEQKTAMMDTLMPERVLPGGRRSGPGRSPRALPASPAIGVGRIAELLELEGWAGN